MAAGGPRHHPRLAAHRPPRRPTEKPHLDSAVFGGSEASARRCASAVAGGPRPAGRRRAVPCEAARAGASIALAAWWSSRRRRPVRRRPTPSASSSPRLVPHAKPGPVLPAPAFRRSRPGPGAPRSLPRASW